MAALKKENLLVLDSKHIFEVVQLNRPKQLLPDEFAEHYFGPGVSFQKIYKEALGGGVVLYHQGETEGARNELAESLLRKYCKKNHDRQPERYGRFVVAADNLTGGTFGMDGSQHKQFRQFLQATASSELQKRNQRPGKFPTKAKDGCTLFISERCSQGTSSSGPRPPSQGAEGKPLRLQGTSREALLKEWNAMNAEDKEPYERKACEAKERYEADMMEYKKYNPEPPLPPRTAKEFHTEAKSTEGKDHVSWAKLGDEERTRFIDMASLDLTRYEAERAALQAHCQQHGLNFDSIMSKHHSKKRKRDV